MTRPEFSLGFLARFRWMLVLALAGLTAGCFQPLYGDKSTVGGDSIRDKMSSVEVAKVVALLPTRLPRVAVEVRNQLIFELTGGGAANTTAYELKSSISSTNLAIVVDKATGRIDTQVYGIEATYRLIEVGTGKSVVTGATSARVTYNTPGQEQRFANERALRDAEDRAAKVIAETIRSRLASYFAAGA